MRQRAGSVAAAVAICGLHCVKALHYLVDQKLSASTCSAAAVHKEDCRCAMRKASQSCMTFTCWEGRHAAAAALLRSISRCTLARSKQPPRGACRETRSRCRHRMCARSHLLLSLTLLTDGRPAAAAVWRPLRCGFAAAQASAHLSTCAASGEQLQSRGSRADCRLAPDFCMSSARAQHDAMRLTAGQRYAVIGGGLAGVATAWHLLQGGTPASPVHLELFDPAGDFCCSAPHQKGTGGCSSTCQTS